MSVAAIGSLDDDELRVVQGEGVRSCGAMVSVDFEHCIWRLRASNAFSFSAIASTLFSPQLVQRSFGISRRHAPPLVP
jgi:hypothetical protein